MIRPIRLIAPETTHDETMRILTPHPLVIIGASTRTMQVLTQHQHLDFAYFRVETLRQRMRHIGFRRFCLADMRFRAQRPHRVQQAAEPLEAPVVLTDDGRGERDDGEAE